MWQWKWARCCPGVAANRYDDDSRDVVVADVVVADDDDDDDGVACKLGDEAGDLWDIALPRKRRPSPPFFEHCAEDACLTPMFTCMAPFSRSLGSIVYHAQYYRGFRSCTSAISNPSKSPLHPRVWMGE